MRYVSTTILISICIRLERAFDLDTDIVGLFLGEGGQLDSNLAQMQTGDLFVQMLRQVIDPHFIVVLLITNEG